ncbi:Dolichol-phosphate mannosyltransferase subunit 3, partial [Characodon lateralis]|nr:Dolichol-phosphate mannosyltransferase subunit 3 [Characodon lateralis]
QRICHHISHKASRKATSLFCAELRWHLLGGLFVAETSIMTKLLQWLLGVSLLGAIWTVVAFDLLELSLPRTYREVAWPMPLYLLVSFGCYSLATVGYRVATFNDCDEAARELQEQIREAKDDLKKKGLRM